MAKKKKEKEESKSDIFNFRTGTPEKKKELKERTSKLKNSKDITQKDIYINGLLVEEGKDEEQTVLNKKNLKKAVRNEALDLVIESNAVIRAYNLRLKALNPKRYKFLDEDEGTIKLYDEKGNRII